MDFYTIYTIILYWSDLYEIFFSLVKASVALILVFTGLVGYYSGNTTDILSMENSCHGTWSTLSRHTGAENTYELLYTEERW